jgi:hypothetical protein
MHLPALITLQDASWGTEGPKQTTPGGPYIARGTWGDVCFLQHSSHKRVVVYALGFLGLEPKVYIYNTSLKGHLTDVF